MAKAARMGGTIAITGRPAADRQILKKPRYQKRMRIEKRLKVDFAWVLSGNVLYSACQWGIVLVLAKLGSPAQVGEYALGMAVGAPILLFANLQLRVLLASDVRDQFTFGQYLSFRLVALGAAMLLIGAVAAWSQPDWSRGGVIILVGLAQSLEYLSDMYYGLMQRHERMDRISRSLMLKGPLSLAALCGAMFFTRTVAWAVIALALGRLFILMVWDARLDFARKAQAAFTSRLEWNSGHFGLLLRMSLPLGVIALLNSLNSNIPRYFVEAHGGNTELGIFSAIASLLSAGSLVVSAFGQAIFLPVAKACGDFDRGRYRAFVVQTVALGGILGGAATVVVSLLGREILAHIFRPEYGERADIFVRLMIAGTIMFIACGLGYVMTAARSLNPQIPLLLATAVATAAASAWWVPRHGLEGAANAAIASALVQLAGSGVVLLRIDRQLQEDRVSAAQEYESVEA